MVGEGHPLILVFYIDRLLMENQEMIKVFADSVNQDIVARGSNIMAFFLPTDDNERIECINPVMVKEADMDKINKMVDEIATKFDVGKVDLNDETA